MARDNKEDLSFLDPSLNKKIAQKIQTDVDNAYKKTYYTDNKNAKYIDSIRRNMDKDLSGLIDRTKLRNNGNNISQLYARTLATNDNEMMKEFKSILQDESMLSDIMDMYSQNAIQRDIDREIDVVCKYVPKLAAALDIKTDHVLCADHFNKKNDNLEINQITNATSNGNNTNDNQTNQYAAKSDIDSFKKKYHLIELAHSIYEKTAKYGEQFIYIVAYNKALGRLLNKGQNSDLLSEDGILNEEAIDTELASVNETLDFKYTEKDVNDIIGLNENVYCLNEENSSTINLANNNDYDSISVELNKTGVIPGVLQRMAKIERIMKETASLVEADGLYPRETNLTNRDYFNTRRKEFSNFAKGGTLKSPTSLATDGFVDKKKQDDQQQINIPGCVVEVLDHTMVKPIYIKDICLGYYYIECNRNMDMDVQTTFSSTLGGLRPRRSTRARENMNRTDQDNDVLIKIAKQISQKIDATFVNANQDLAKEIYGILKYNSEHGSGKVSKIRVSFIPPEDIVHSYFSLNEKTHRGESDLKRSLFPAKLLSCLYISNEIALLTRGYDKRVYHVRNSAADTNIQAVLLNVINQIKQSNFNLRQIENMNNILNITGRFNDLVIPQNANGESPVNFEIMPGQNVEVKTEFMNMLEEMAVSQTGVSLEMVNSRDQEQTATHITMTNARFLVKIFARQQQYADILSEIFTKIYQCEYGVEDDLEVNLPPPVMLNFTNTSQILTVANELIQNIVQMKMGGEQDEQLKSVFIGKLMKYYFKSFLPMEEIDKMADEAKIELAEMRGSQSQDQMNGMQPQGGF